MKNRRIERKSTMQVVIDTGYWEMLKIAATKAHMPIKDFLEGILSDYFSNENKIK